MASTTANGIEIAYEALGEPGRPTVLLVAGLGEQLVSWHDAFCELLIGRGFRVVRFDNRDCGLSEGFDDAGIPDVAAGLMSGSLPDPPYTLDDMADDAIGLLDALDVDAAHVAGASMGGMIAQTVAINHPERVHSLTSIMSTTGNRDLPRGTPQAWQGLLAPPVDPSDPDAIVERGLMIRRVLQSPGFPAADDVLARRIRQSVERAYRPAGIARQLAAVLAHGDRRPGLQKLDVPTVVLHGDADPLIPVEAGVDTAETVPGAELRVVEGMAHDFPDALVETFADAITAAADRSGAPPAG